MREIAGQGYAAQACPITRSYPERDFTARAARQLEPFLEAHDVPDDIKTYPEATHSFFNDRGKAYDPEAAVDARARMMGFSGEHLTGADFSVPEGTVEEEAGIFLYI